MNRNLFVCFFFFRFTASTLFFFAVVAFFNKQRLPSDRLVQSRLCCGCAKLNREFHCDICGQLVFEGM